MSILPDLIRSFRSKGLQPLTGYNSHHFFDWRDAPFTVFSQGSSIVGCPGLALQEVMFLEGLGAYLNPRNCLVIGNAMGWSTIATGLTFPNAKTIGIDNAARDGIDFTNQAFKELSLKGGAVLAESPAGVAGVAAHFDGPVEFCLIDAVHDNTAIQQDFKAVREIAAPTCVYLFHDVINWGMLPGFNSLIAASGLNGFVLTRTPSGMALAAPKPLAPDLETYLSVFTDDPDLFRRYRATVRASFDKLASFDQDL